MTFDIAPFRALRFTAETGEPSALVAPPYDIISPAEHRRLLERSPLNIVRLTLGEAPGERESYETRGRRLIEWKERGVLRPDAAPALYVYGCDYTVPGSERRAQFRGLVALGRLRPFEDRVVLPHEHTFPGVVSDRLRLLEATRTHLESIFLLYEDPERRIDAALEDGCRGEPLIEVEGRPGESHALWSIRDPDAVARLKELLAPQRPIIADGHHRYTTALQYRRSHPEDAPAAWQPMVLGNLVGDGLSILATHRLVDCGGRTAEALEILRQRLDPVDLDAVWDYRVETRGGVAAFRVPESLRRGCGGGVAASDYALLHDVVLGEWLCPALAPAGADLPVAYFKEGSGEGEALERGDGDLVFRMRPVAPREFRAVVDGGEVFPHKTTFFYPKLWSGLVLWSLERVG